MFFQCDFILIKFIKRIKKENGEMKIEEEIYGAKSFLGEFFLEFFERLKKFGRSLKKFKKFVKFLKNI
jgi:hypothetical protein